MCRLNDWTGSQAGPVQLRILTFIFLLLLAAACQPKPYGPVPTEAQLRWQQMEYNMFVHFGPNTFSGAEWGSGTEPEDLFNPTELDCLQWAATAQNAGMKGIIVTAKHHDGFCLWPSRTSTHTVAQSSWRGGQGDVLKELSDACREYGLNFGVYLSPWDRNHPLYGTPAYNDAYVAALQEIHDGRYGPVFEHWFDGACGEGPTGKRQAYDWPRFFGTIQQRSPQTILFSDIGPGCRWVGNEQGRASQTAWSRLDTEGFTPGAGAPPIDTLQCGNVHGTAWVPVETDVSIRPGWFWRESETAQLKTADALLDIWLTSVGRNSVLLLNVPADTRGRIPSADSLRLMEFRALRERVFGNNLAQGSRQRLRGNTLELNLPQAVTFNLIELQEDISLGQRVFSFQVETEKNGNWTVLTEGTTIGYKRILPVPGCTSSHLRIRVTGTYAPPMLLNAALYLRPVLHNNL